MADIIRQKHYTVVHWKEGFWIVIPALKEEEMTSSPKVNLRIQGERKIIDS